MEELTLNKRISSLSKLCSLLGISRQSYYQHNRNNATELIKMDLVLQQVHKIRNDHRFMGTRKLYHKLQNFMVSHNIKLGRDKFFDLLAAHKLLIRRRKRRVITTYSYHNFRKYPNLIKDKVATNINQIWVSDISYWKIKSKKFVYLSFITDVFSHKIVGYNLADNLKVVSSIKPLKEALSSLLRDSTHSFELIHHSDRGIQYCNNAYTKKLKKQNIKISMTENSDPRENAIAERVNGIIKNEYLKGLKPSNLKEAKNMLTQAVELYNKERPHLSIGLNTPEQIHDNPKLQAKQLWKNYYINKKINVKQFQD